MITRSNVAESVINDAPEPSGLYRVRARDPRYRWRARIRHPKTGAVLWACPHPHPTEDEAGDCAADNMHKVAVIDLEPEKRQRTVRGGSDG